MFDKRSSLFVVYILLAGFALQYSQKAFVLLDFVYNQNEIANTKCENRFKTILACKGSCVLAKKIIEVEKHETKAPASIKADEKPPYFQYVSLTFNIFFPQILQAKFIIFYPLHFQNFYLSIFHPPD